MTLEKAIRLERRDLAARRAASLRNLVFFDATHAVFVFMQQPFDTREATDIGMYAQTLMPALTSRDIASCGQGALGLSPPLVRQNLGVPEDHRLLFGVAFGYEDVRAPADAARTVRASLQEAVVFHR